MADTPDGTSNLSVSDATSLLMTPPPEVETVEDEAQQEPEIVEDDEVQDSVEEDDAEAEEAEAEDDEIEDVIDEEEAEDSEDEQPETVSVTVDGETYEVTLEEAAKGYQRQSAFTKRMQELATERKQFEAERQQTLQDRDAYAQGLQQIDQLLAQQSQEPDWDSLRLELPAEEYARRFTDHQRAKEQRQNILAEQQRIAREQQIEQRDLMKQHLNSQAELMLDKIPQWRDESVRQTERQELIKFAKAEYGYTDEEIANASDHRAIKQLYDSWQFSKVSDKANTAKKRVRKAPKMAKAGTPRSKSEVQARTRQKRRAQFDKQPSIKNAVDYLLKTQT
mgnify:FL=1